MTTIGIVVGSTRPGRKGPEVAAWIHDLAVERAGGDAKFEIIDVHEHALPLLDEPFPAMRAPGEQPHTRRWATAIDACDGYVFVTPEYNAGPPASLTNAIDYLYAEWASKPVAYVGYGVFGAVMAVQKLRAQAGVLRMADIGPQVTLTLADDFVAFTEFRPQDTQAARLHALVDELLAWSRALAVLRAPVDA